MSSKSKSSLKIDWATHDAAKYAVEHWHYSRTMPKSKLAKFGVWENEKFIGAVIYGVGATYSLVKRYGLEPYQGCELVRVALTTHKTEVSRIISITLKLLKNKYPGIKLVVSFADPEKGHIGCIYKAGGWIYSGMSQASNEYIYKGKRWQGRSFRNSFKGLENSQNVQIVKGSSKYRYLMPMDNETKKQIQLLAKDYPRAKNQALENPSSLGGEIPTCALQLSI